MLKQQLKYCCCLLWGYSGLSLLKTQTNSIETTGLIAYYVTGCKAPHRWLNWFKYTQTIEIAILGRESCHLL